MRAARLAPLLSLLVSSGCAGTGSGPVAPIDVVRRCPIECEGAVGCERPPLGEREPPDDDSLFANERFSADVHVGVVDAASIAAWTDGRFGALALVVARASIDDAFARHSELGISGAVTVASGRVAVVADEHHLSFVERFDFKTLPEVAILDPVVGTYSVGRRVEVTPRRDEQGDTWTVDVATLSLDSPRANLDGSVHVLGVGDPVHVQVPLIARVHTHASARLERGESLLLIAPELLDRSRVLVAVVSPDWPLPTE